MHLGLYEGGQLQLCGSIADVSPVIENNLPAQGGGAQSGQRRIRVESIFMKEGEWIHPVTFLPLRKPGNLRTYVEIHFLHEKEAFCNKIGILSSFNKMSILFLEIHMR